MWYTAPVFFAIWLLHPVLSASSDPCADIAGKQFVPTRDARACLKSFLFNETLRQNVLQVVSRVMDFYTFEDYYSNSPPPFQESTVDIRRTLYEIGKRKYNTDYDFNMDLYDFTVRMNDGHTVWFPSCYTRSFTNMLPLPIVRVEVHGQEGIHVAFDSVEFLSQLGNNFTDYYDSIGFDWKRFAGAKVIKIEDQYPEDYVDLIANTVSGNFLDHGVRTNSVFSSYLIVMGAYSQRLGDFAGSSTVQKDSVKMTLVPVGSGEMETVTVPYLALFTGNTFTDSASFWTANCAANSATNGIDFKQTLQSSAPIDLRRPIKKGLVDDSRAAGGIALPPQFQPGIPPVNGSEGSIKAYVLPDKKTGVIFVGTFHPSSPGGPFVAIAEFEQDVVDAVSALKAAGVTQLLIDLTNNPGGFICLGQFLHYYLSGGSPHDAPGFVSTMRANPLARKIVAANIELGLNSDFTFYAPDNWKFLNGTNMPLDYNYFEPSLDFVVNGKNDPTSQRIFDNCDILFSQTFPDEPPFDLRNVAIVSNAWCASTCAQFSTVMSERHNIPIAVFGGRKGRGIEYKGMAGLQVLEWADLDSEIKTADLKNDPMAPPDLLVDSNMRVNWRTAWSWKDPNVPIQYRSEHPTYRFSYTKETYNNPLNLWIFAAKQLFEH